VHKLDSEDEAAAALRSLSFRAHGNAHASAHWNAYVLQKYAGPRAFAATDAKGAGPDAWIEARLYGSRGLFVPKLSERAWSWDPVVFARAPAAVARVKMQAPSPALVAALDRFFAADGPLNRMSAAALDVRAPSLAALQRGEFYVLEVNGAFGVAHTWRRGLDRGDGVWTLCSAVWDLARWLAVRTALGAQNLATGEVDAWERIQQEAAWARAAAAAAWEGWEGEGEGEGEGQRKGESERNDLEFV